MACPSYGFVQMQLDFFVACGALFSVLLLHSSFPFVRLFRSYFVPLFLSSDFSVPLLFLFSALQTFPFLFVPLFRSSDFSARISFLFSVLLSARHFLDGGVFRSIGIFFLGFAIQLRGVPISTTPPQNKKHGTTIITYALENPTV